MNQVIYNGAFLCHTSNCCPVAELDDKGIVTLHDPSKPQNGNFKMTVDEWNQLISTASVIGSKE